MKSLLISLLVAVLAFAAGWRLSLHRGASAIQRPGGIAAFPSKSPGPAIPGSRAIPLAARPAPPAASGSQPDPAGEALASAIDSLTSSQTSLSQRRALLDQLQKSGRLEEAVAALKTLAAESPNDPSLATVLGEAEIAQLTALAQDGGDQNQIAILALQADQSFDAALALEPSDWEAQFYKAAAMAHWPPEMNKGPEVIHRLSTLVAQQEAAPAPQPEFAQTYAILGEQYLAAGQADKAAQVWQQGLSRFPLNPSLQQEVARAGAP
jgi:tetratricopeptide (TPR) repeat protein